MTAKQKPSKALNITLWTVQILLFLSLLSGGIMKLFIPVEKLAEIWPWAAEVSVAFLKFTGIVDLLGAFGLILPAVFKFQPKLVPITATCVTILMICASAFHVSRGEASDIGANIVFGLMAVFVAWGRFKFPVNSK